MNTILTPAPLLLSQMKKLICLWIFALAATGVSAADPSLAGTYHGLVSRGGETPVWTNSHLGARLEVTVTATNNLSGKIISTGSAISFTGHVEGSEGYGTSSVTIKRGTQPSLALDLNFADNLVSGSLTHPDESVAVTGWRNVWNKTNHQATEYKGRHNFLVHAELGEIGDGFGNVTVGADGSAVINGKLPDGSVFKTTTFIGPEGQVLIYQTLYAKVGSFTGALQLTPSADGIPSTLTTISPDVTWFKPLQAAKDRFFREGFSTPCQVNGGLYVPPAAGDIAAGLPDVVENGYVRFTGLASGSERLPDTYFTLTSAGKLTMAPKALNPAVTTLTIKPATGEFSGGFTLVDNDYNNPTGEDREGNTIYKKFTRKVKYEGLIIDDGHTATVSGYYLTASNPDPGGDPPTTLTTSPLTGGFAVIEPNPAAPPAVMIGFEETAYTIAESEALEARLLVDNPTDKARTFSVKVVTETATAADLTTAAAISLTIPANETQVSFLLPVKNDGIEELEETFRLVLVDGPGYDLTENSFIDVTITDDDFPIDIFSHPQSQIVNTGGEHVFDVDAEGSDKVHQWQRNTTAIPGATSSSFALLNAKLADGGLYRVVVSNAINSQTSNSAELAVVDSGVRLVALAADTTATLEATFTAPANSLSFQWKFFGSDLVDDTGPNPRISGATSARLVIKHISATDIGDYVCLVTQNATAMGVATGEFRVRVPEAVPVLSELDLPEGQILRPYHYEVLFDTALETAPGSFSATGLPAGLSIDPNTGIISGTPTTPTASAPVAISATNPKGTTTVHGTLTIKAFPGGALGTFHGLVDRLPSAEELGFSPWARCDLGARLELTTTETGSFSGKLLNGSTLNFSGALKFEEGDFLTASVLVPQGTGLPPLQLEISINPETQVLSGRLHLESELMGDFGAPAWGWRNAWTTTAPATAYVGRFNFSIACESLTGPEIPGGTGYGTCVVPASGTFNVTGLMPDGTAFISNTFVGPTGQLLLFQPLYKVPGTLLGAAQIVLPDMEVPAPGLDPFPPYVRRAELQTDLGEELSTTWNRPAQTDPKDKLYRAGFPVQRLIIDGGRYTPPESGQIVMDLPDVTLNGKVYLSGDGGTEALPQPLTISDKGTSTLPKNNNPMKMTFTVNKDTGEFNGAFTKYDEDPDRPPLYDVNGNIKRAQGYFSRAGRYYGIVVPTSTGYQSGLGLFTIPELPQPYAEPPVTATNAQTIAGQVRLDRNDEAPPPVLISFAEGSELHTITEEEPPLTLTVVVSEPSSTKRTIPISIQHRTTTAADVTLSSATVVFQPNQTEAFVTLSIQQDAIDEGDEVFYLKLADGPGYNLEAGRMPFIILDDDEMVEIVTQPASALLFVGEPISLSVDVTGSEGLTYQWRRNGQNILGAVQPSLTIEISKFNDAGTYDVVVANPINSVTSDPATVGLIDLTDHYVPVALGGKATLPLKINVPAGFVTYDWGMADDARITGNTTSTLVINSVGEDDEGDYYCSIKPTWSDEIRVSGFHRVQLVSQPPSLLDITPLSAAVAQYFEYQLEFDLESYRRPGTFTADNLPAGLTIDSTSGRISGIPTTAVENWSVTITATNAAGFDTKTFLITVDPLPDGMVGSFYGFVDRNVGDIGGDEAVEFFPPWADAELGGLFEVTVTASGAYTGKVTYAGVASSFSGNITVEAGVASLSAAIARTGKPTLYVAGGILAETSESFGGMLSTAPPGTGGIEVPVTAWRQTWSINHQATAYAGSYTIAMRSEEGDHDRSPGGYGFASFTVPTSGAAFVITGRLPDGTAFDCSSYLGPNGEFVIHKPVYARLGSIIASLHLSAPPDASAGEPVFVQPVLGASLFRPRQTAATEVIYKGGIGPVSLVFEGGRQVVPTPGTIIMDLPDSDDNAGINFMGAGVDSSMTLPNTYFRIKANGTTTMTSENPGTVAVTVKPASSEFSGTFKLVDPNPLNEALTIPRSATYNGRFIHTSDGRTIGLGYFILKQLPVPEVTTVSTAPTYTGIVEIVPSGF